MLYCNRREQHGCCCLVLLRDRSVCFYFKNRSRRTRKLSFVDCEKPFQLVLSYLTLYEYSRVISRLSSPRDCTRKVTRSVVSLCFHYSQRANNLFWTNQTVFYALVLGLFVKGRMTASACAGLLGILLWTRMYDVVGGTFILELKTHLIELIPVAALFFWIIKDHSNCSNRTKNLPIQRFFSHQDQNDLFDYWIVHSISYKVNNVKKGYNNSK